ncbi:MAG: hypothetical protein KC944_24895, partial [Candidatus Omnitrophica bacterium]|nr:hypothetical protein [Candidatus Omnitrophota bacterium]
MGLVLLPGLRAGVADSEKTWAEEASIEDLVQKIKEDEAWLWDVDSILIKASILQTSTEEAIKAQREYFEEFNRVSNRRVTISSDTEKEIDLIQGWDKSRYIHKTVEDDGRLSENLFAEGKSISRHGNMEENQIYETFGNSTDHLARDSFSYLSFGRLTDANTWWGKDKKRSMQFPVPPIESFTDGGVIERSGKEYRVIRSLRPSHREYWIETETGKLGYAVTYNTLSPSRADFAKDGRSRTGFLKHLARLLLSEEKFPGTYDSFMMWLEGANEDETEQFASILSQVFPDEVPTKNPEDALLRNYENVMRDLLDLLSSEDVLKDPVERIHESMMA